MLRGNFSAKIDPKGRLKIPNEFLAFVREQYGSELYVTSITGENVLIYPMPVWVGMEEKIKQTAPSEPSIAKFVDRVNFFGQNAELDSQGRVVIHARLREAAMMNGAVDVFGRYRYLDVWNHDRFVAKLQREPFNEQDAKVVAGFGL